LAYANGLQTPLWRAASVHVVAALWKLRHWPFGEPSTSSQHWSSDVAEHPPQLVVSQAVAQPVERRHAFVSVGATQA
jgi:hypothetical protein